VKNWRKDSNLSLRKSIRFGQIFDYRPNVSLEQTPHTARK
jgi:hypothetical protein